jgi:hypothetical protein
LIAAAVLEAAHDHAGNQVALARRWVLRDAPVELLVPLASASARAISNLGSVAGSAMSASCAVRAGAMAEPASM